MAPRRRSRTRRVLVATVAIGAFALLAASCDRNDEVDSLSATYGVPSNQIDAEAETWVLDTRESSIELAGGRRVTLEVDDDRVFGQGPCNSYRGTIEIDGDSVSITKLTSTQRGCEARVERAETRYFAALEAADTIDVSDEELELTDGQRLVFTPR